MLSGNCENRHCELKVLTQFNDQTFTYKMDRRTFLRRSALLAAGGFLAAMSPTLAEAAVKAATKGSLSFDSEAYKRFKNSQFKYHPYVRWWWNGDKVEAEELIRELHLLKEAGIAGVEINPIAFPTTGDDMGKRSLRLPIKVSQI